MILWPELSSRVRAETRARPPPLNSHYKKKTLCQILPSRRHRYSELYTNRSLKLGWVIRSKEVFQWNLRCRDLSNFPPSQIWHEILLWRQWVVGQHARNETCARPFTKMSPRHFPSEASQAPSNQLSLANQVAPGGKATLRGQAINFKPLTRRKCLVNSRMPWKYFPLCYSKCKISRCF